MFTKCFSFVVALLIIFIFAFQSSVSKELNDEIINKLIKPDNIGNDFWFTVPPGYETINPENAVKIYIFSEYTTFVMVEVKELGLVKTINTKPFEVVEISLTPLQAQPYNKMPDEDEKASAIYHSRAVHLSSDMPVGVYVLVKYEASSDGFLALPNSVLGKEYIVSSYDALYSGTEKLPSLVGIVAPYDATRVTIKIGGNTGTKTSDNLTPGETMSVNLMQGDVFMLSSIGDSSDLSGTTIFSNNPIAVVAGHQCANVPRTNRYCDYLVEMLPGVETWGTQYVVPQMPYRTYSSIIRVFAKLPDTKVYRDGKLVATLNGPGGLKGNGWLEMRLNQNIEVPYPILLSADKPIQVVFYNTGSQEDGEPLKAYDPFEMVLTPREQHSKYVPFAMPKSSIGTGYKLNFFSVSFKPSAVNTIPSNLLFGVSTEDTSKFYTLSNYYQASACNIVVDKELAEQSFEPPPDHTLYLFSPDSLGVYLYGFNVSDSYGFPAYLYLKNIEKAVDTLPPKPTWTLNENSAEIRITAIDLPDDPDLRSNFGSVLFNEAESYNIEYSADPIIPSVSYRANINCLIIDLKKDARAKITFADRNGNDTTISINYYIIDFKTNPESYDFGTVMKNKEKSKYINIVNNSNTEIHIATITPMSHPDIFTVRSDYSTTIAAKSSGTFVLVFKGDELGVYNDKIKIIAEEKNTSYEMEVAGKVGEPQITASDIDFGIVPVGQSAIRQALVANPGNVPLEIIGYFGPDKDCFTTDLPELSKDNTIIIQPGSVYAFNVTFSPDAAGDFSDMIVFSNNANKLDSITVLNGKAEASSVAFLTDDRLISVYPVPTKDFLSLKLNISDTSVKIKVKNEQGKELTNFVTVSGVFPEFAINTKELVSGAYFLEVSSKNHNYIRKFVVER